MRTSLRELRQLIREAAYAGMFKKGDHVLFGKYKNKKGKIVDMYLDDKGHPTIEIEPIPKGRKKIVTMGLYKVWKPDEDFDEEKLNESLIRENVEDYVLRGRENVLVRRESESSKDWRWHVTKKVLYFTADDLVSGPRSPMDNQTWTFRQGEWLIAVHEDQFFKKPEWQFKKRF